MGAARGPHTSSRRYGIGFGPGTGGHRRYPSHKGIAPDCKVGIRVSLPWFDAVSPGKVVEHVPVKVLMFL